MSERFERWLEDELHQQLDPLIAAADSRPGAARYQGLAAPSWRRRLGPVLGGLTAAKFAAGAAVALAATSTAVTHSISPAVWVSHASVAAGDCAGGLGPCLIAITHDERIRAGVTPFPSPLPSAPAATPEPAIHARPHPSVKVSPDPEGSGDSPEASSSPGTGDRTPAGSHAHGDRGAGSRDNSATPGTEPDSSGKGSPGDSHQQGGAAYAAGDSHGDAGNPPAPARD